MKKLFVIVSLLFFSVSLQAKKEGLTREIFKPPVEGKIYFSNLPFTGNSPNTTKTNFTSAENIYARLEIPSGTIKEAFKIREDNKTTPFVKCSLTVLRGGEVIHYGTTTDHILVTDEFKNSNFLNFDILPEPAKATTLYSMLDDFSAGYGFNPISGLIINGRWPDGDYTVRVRIFTETFNAYGSLQSEDKWPALEGEFNLKFREDDAVKIIADTKLISEKTVENAFRYEKLPDVFSNPGKLTDPNATSAKIAAILKRDLPERQILKWVAESYNGPYWHIAKDDYGLPKYKYFNPHIWMVYKINGKCYVGDATLRQDYSGGGTYGALHVGFTSAGNVPDRGIDCSKVR
jgi:hypothetical protein